MSQATIFGQLTNETNAVAAAISAEVAAKKAAKEAKAAAKAAAIPADKPAAKKPAAKKPAAKPAEAATKPEAKPAKVKAEKPATKAVEQAAAVDIEDARKAFVDACLLRQKRANEINAAKGVGECKTIISDLSWFGHNDKDNADYARKILAAMQKLGFDLFALAAHFANTESGKGKPYIAVKAITKARQMFTALATNNITDFDGYTYAVLVNMVQTGRALDSHEMMACVSKSVKAHKAQSKGVPLEAIKDSDPSTANTQVCSTRGFLGDLGILKVQKGKVGDRPEWADNEMANTVKAWFVKHIEE